MLILLGKTEIERPKGMPFLFDEHDDLIVENFVNGIAKDYLQIVGSESILGEFMIKFGSQQMGHATILGIRFYAGWYFRGANQKRWNIFAST